MSSTPITAEDRANAVRLFLYGFGSAAAYILARTIADSAFLSHIGPDRLPPVLMLAAGVVALSSLIYGQFVRRFPVRLVVLLTLTAQAATSAAMPITMFHFADSVAVFAVVYLIAQVRGSLGTIQFATLIGEQFREGTQERVVGYIGFGATLAGITVGLMIGLVADDVNVESLMYLAAGIDLATMLPVMALRSRASGDEQKPLSGAGMPATDRRLRDALRSPYVLSIAGLVMVSVLAATLVEFQWKVTAASVLQRDEEQLAEYFGYFYGTVYLVTGLLQLFATSRVLQKRGVLVGLLAFPSALLATTSAAWLLSVDRLLLWTLTLSKGCDTLKRSMNDPSIQVVYSALDSDLRQQAITLVAGMAKPLAEALAGLALVALVPWISTRQISLPVIGLILIWLLLNWRVWRGFSAMRRA